MLHTTKETIIGFYRVKKEGVHVEKSQLSRGSCTHKVIVLTIMHVTFDPGTSACLASHAVT